MCVCVSQCVASESEVFSRRHATPRHDKGFIDWWSDGGGKNSCRLEDVTKSHTHRSPSPNLLSIPDPPHITSVLKGGGGRKAESYFQSWLRHGSFSLLTLIINFP